MNTLKSDMEAYMQTRANEIAQSYAVAMLANVSCFAAINAALDAAKARLAAADELDPEEDELGLVDEPEINAVLDAMTDVQAGEDATMVLRLGHGAFIGEMFDDMSFWPRDAGHFAKCVCLYAVIAARGTVQPYN